jgi:hypothetical protein
LLPVLPSVGDSDTLFCAALVVVIIIVTLPASAVRLQRALGAAVVWSLVTALVLPQFLLSPFYPRFLDLSRGISAALTSLAGQPLFLGPTASGLWILAAAEGLVACLVLSGFLPVLRGLVAAVILVLSFLLLLVAHTPQSTLFAALIVLAVVTAARYPDRDSAALRLKYPTLIGFSASTLMAGALLLSHVTLFPRSGPIRPSPIILQSSGFGSFSDPSHKSGSDLYLPQFGLLASYLTALGHEVKALRCPLDDGQMEPGATLLVFNPTNPLTVPEKQRLRAFLEYGGTLLLVGDHTNIGSTLSALNSYLADTPIRFRFDTAVPFSFPFTLNMATGFPPHPLRGDGRLTQMLLPWGFGASLTVGWPGCVLFTLKDAFSDRGDTANPPSFLGNEHLDPGEWNGDMPVLASATVGHGHVLVFGDTALFQDPLLFVSIGFIERAVVASHVRSGPLMSEILALLLTIGGAVALLRSTSRRPLTISSCLLYALSVAVAPAWTRHEPRIAGVVHVATYDMTQAQWVAARSGEDGVSLLNGSLHSAGYLPLAFWRPPADLDSVSALGLMINPRSRLSGGAADRLHRILRRGGTVLICAGHAEAENLTDLLKPAGLGVGSIPLGSGAEAGSDVHFGQAYPITMHGPQATVIRSLWGYPVIVMCRSGRGHILLIIDSEYATDRNLGIYPRCAVLLDSLLSLSAVPPDEP